MRFTDEQLEREVLRLILPHRGIGNRLDRWELVERIFGAEARHPEDDGNMHDRKVRGAVESLRRKGYLICDMGDGAGRWMAASMEEYQDFRRKYGSSAFTIIETVREMDRAAEDMFELTALQPRLI
jgi:hypothetical protein